MGAIRGNGRLAFAGLYMLELSIKYGGVIIDELRALRAQAGGDPAPSFAALVVSINAIKLEIPKV